MSIKFGCATADITPNYPVYLCGYGSRNCLSKGVEDKLEVGAMIFSGNRKKTLHLTFDNTGITAADCKRIIAEVSKATGIPAQSIVISCSHTHFAPGVDNYYVTFTKGELDIGIYPGDNKYFKILVKGR